MHNFIGVSARRWPVARRPGARSHKGAPAARVAARLCVALLLASCARGQVQTTAVAPGGLLPRPTHVVVADFSIPAGGVRLDSGIGATLRRQVEGESADAAAAQAARDTQAALADTLAARLAAYGLPAQRLAAGAPPPPGSLLVQGQIETIDQGNRARRLLIGFGAGKSSVSADAQIYYVTNPAAPQFLQSFTGYADSGKMPGAAGTMGVGAAAGTVAASAAVSTAAHAGAEATRTGAAANASALADALARQIGDYATAQGWVAQGVVR